MAKLLVFVVALSTLGYLGYYAMYKTKMPSVEDRVAHGSKRQLDNVREKAREFEVKAQDNINQVQQKSGLDEP